MGRVLSESTNMTVTNADIMVIDGQGWSWTVEDKCLSPFDKDTTYRMISKMLIDQAHPENSTNLMGNVCARKLI